MLPAHLITTNTMHCITRDGVPFNRVGWDFINRSQDLRGRGGEEGHGWFANPACWFYPRMRGEGVVKG